MPAQHVIELFSSEGCSSCPPAEDWLRRTTSTDQNLVGLEFHVDYWDSLGWRDIYSSSRYTTRQQELASHRSSSVVYTPEVIVDGEEWRDWPNHALPSAAPSTHARNPLSFEIVDANPPSVRLAPVSANAASSYRWYLAVTESGLTRAIQSGENRGATLRHADVVRSFLGPFEIDGKIHAIEAPAGTLTRHAKAVALVVRDADTSAVQAFALPLGECAP